MCGASIILPMTARECAPFRVAGRPRIRTSAVGGTRGVRARITAVGSSPRGPSVIPTVAVVHPDDRPDRSLRLGLPGIRSQQKAQPAPAAGRERGRSEVTQPPVRTTRLKRRDRAAERVQQGEY